VEEGLIEARNTISSTVNSNEEATITTMRTLVVFLLIVNITSAFNVFAPISSPTTTSPTSKHINTIDESSNANQNDPPERTIMNRRSLLMGLLAVGTASTLGTGGPSMVVRAEDIIPATATTPVTDVESVYFGVGCFWHIQHEFIVAERELLGRSDRELTAFTGYAGGTAADSFGRVCYHNFQNVADYGKYGHGEVVGMKLPTDKIVDFAKVYFSLYNPKTLGK
jgi:hypothetical protein